MFEKIKNLPLELKASVWYTFCNIAQKSVALLTVPIFTRLLTTEQYGIVTVYHSWQGIICIFTTLNLQYGSFNAAMSHFEADRERYISSVQGLCTLLTVFWCAFYLALAEPLSGLLGMDQILIPALLVQTLFAIPLDFWSGKQRFLKRYHSLIAVTLFMAIMMPAAGVIAVAAVTPGQRGTARILAYALVQILIGGFFYLLNLCRGKKLFDKRYWRFALSFNIPLIPYYLSQLIFNQSDKIMIASMNGQTQAGVYGLACQIAMVITFILNAVNASYLPWLYEKLRTERYEGIGKVTNVIAVLMAALLTFVVFLAPEFILFLGGSEYAEAVWAVPPIAMSSLLLFYTQLSTNIEFYYEEKYYLVAGSILSAIVNIVLNFIFIPVFGFIAASYTTLASYLIFCAMNYLCMKRACRKHRIADSVKELYNIKFLSCVLCGFGCVEALLLMLYRQGMLRWGCLLALLIFLCIERSRIRKFIRTVKTVSKESDDRERSVEK